MLRYLVGRVLQAVVVLWAAYTLVFVLLSVLPSDPIAIRINAPDSGLTAEDGDRLREYYGLDKPLILQYLSHLLGVLRGDFGFSLTKGTPVGTMIGAALPATVQLSLVGLVIGLLLGAFIAVAASYGPFSWLRRLLRTVPALFAAVPTFLFGILFIQLFAFRLGVLPAVDDGSTAALLGPALTLGIGISPPLAQVLFASLESVRREPYVDVARAKGAGHGSAFRHHVLRNALLPWLTLLGLTFGELLAGSIVTETVFSRDGLGRITEAAVTSQDLPVIQAVVLLVSALYVAVNLVVDLLYPFVDPRLRVAGKVRRPRRASIANAEGFAA